ncbi:MAG: GNAT family N-acetyltransferase [Armatimonas sp.]
MEQLNHIFWNALSGSQRPLTLGTDTARRYAPGISPLAAFADPKHPDFDALASHCTPGEKFYCYFWTEHLPTNWRIEHEFPVLRMLWQGTEISSPDPEGIVRLGPEHTEQAMELTALTRPGPFGPRTMELGEYFGVFENGRLCAMTGERLYATPLREVSAVCTHPDFQGRGLARRLMTFVMHRQLQRGEIPFLHVATENTVARSLYERLGFRNFTETLIRVIECKESSK